MSDTPVRTQTRRLTLQLPAPLVEWVQEAAAISHRTVEGFLQPVIEGEKARWEANWDCPAQAD
jgi:hypothetical protein